MWKFFHIFAQWGLDNNYSYVGAEYIRETENGVIIRMFHPVMGGMGYNDYWFPKQESFWEESK